MKMTKQASLRLARIKAAEFYRSEKGRALRKAQAQKLQANRPLLKKTCQNCQSFFYSKSLREQKFCAKKCKTAFRRKHGLDDVVGNCIICNKEFKYNIFTNNLTCSKSCLVKQKSKDGKEGYLKKDGYRVISRANHPNARKGKILEHVFVMSEHLGRALSKK